MVGTDESPNSLFQVGGSYILHKLNDIYRGSGELRQCRTFEGTADIWPGGKQACEDMIAVCSDPTDCQGGDVVESFRGALKGTARSDGENYNKTDL